MASESYQPCHPCSLCGMLGDFSTKYFGIQSFPNHNHFTTWTTDSRELHLPTHVWLQQLLEIGNCYHQECSCCHSVYCCYRLLSSLNKITVGRILESTDIYCILDLIYRYLPVEDSFVRSWTEIFFGDVDVIASSFIVDLIVRESWLVMRNSVIRQGVRSNSSVSQPWILWVCYSLWRVNIIYI
jgi:hypothetical protein